VKKKGSHESPNSNKAAATPFLYFFPL